MIGGAFGACNLAPARYAPASCRRACCTARARASETKPLIGISSARAIGLKSDAERRAVDIGAERVQIGWPVRAAKGAGRPDVVVLEGDARSQGKLGRRLR
jgi:hypothetical protein